MYVTACMYEHAYMIYLYIYIHTCIHTYTHTYIHTHIHTYTHTHTHTWIVADPWLIHVYRQCNGNVLMHHLRAAQLHVHRLSCVCACVVGGGGVCQCGRIDHRDAQDHQDAQYVYPRTRAHTNTHTHTFVYGHHEHRTIKKLQDNHTRTPISAIHEAMPLPLVHVKLERASSRLELGLKLRRCGCIRKPLGSCVRACVRPCVLECVVGRSRERHAHRSVDR